MTISRSKISFLNFQVFKRHGLAQVSPLGEKFNPNHHEALFEQVLII